MRWLWLDKGCFYVLQERTPVYNMGQPDVIGMSRDRYLTEIEIKKSASDFRADFKKPHRVNRHLFLDHAPRQFYYLMPPELAEKLADEIPEWAGLLTLDENMIACKVLKVAPVNKQSKRISVKQCVRAARMMVAHMMGYVLAAETVKSNYKYQCEMSPLDWVDCEQGTYEI